MTYNQGKTGSARDPALWRNVVATLSLSAIGFGFLMELIILSVSFLSFDQLPSTIVFVAGVLQQIAWSFLICSALITAAVLADSQSSKAALFSILLTPISVAVMNALQKGVGEFLSLPVATGDVKVFGVLLARVTEYTVLNVSLVILKRNGQSQLWKFLTAGVIVGCIGGGTVSLLLFDPSGSIVERVSTVIKEVGWPVLCVCFMYLAMKSYAGPTP